MDEDNGKTLSKPSLSTPNIGQSERKTRDFLGLAQTSRQIRSEYYTIWISTTYHRVHLPDVEDYTQTFFSAVNETVLKSCSPTLDIQLPLSLIQRPACCRDWVWRYVDLLPLIKTLDLIPNLKVLFTFPPHKGSVYADPRGWMRVLRRLCSWEFQDWMLTNQDWISQCACLLSQYR